MSRCAGSSKHTSPRVGTVLFACVHNAGRSQMAAALFNELVDPFRARAISAGTQPGRAVHPEVVEVMREIGIDLAGVAPRLLTAELAAEATRLVTMGCSEECPVVPGVPREDWPLSDPQGRPLDEVRCIRDEIRQRVEKLARMSGWIRVAVDLIEQDSDDTASSRRNPS